MAVGGSDGGSGGAPQASPSRIWSFAGCTLDERCLELKVGDRVADLDRKPLEMLLHLLRHAGEVVTKDELVEAVWPGRIISDSNLTKTVAVMRAALGEAGQSAVKTVHGYGYRLVAPVSVRTPVSAAPPALLTLTAGDSPPLRPNWCLESRLGAGGQGEVWLARHAQTREPRVFKFAEAGRSLTALKREITLNRLLRETLPGRKDFLHLLGWNVEEPPFFLESEYLEDGNLAAWAESQGGLAAVPLPQRLELVAQVADAVAAAHGVGVLHKDLKPANVLVLGDGERWRIKLCDFGSGTVLDPGALAAHGIQRMGFTQTVQLGADTSGTPIYFAPEVIAEQPFTVKSDLYSIGVILYQLVAGDTRKALAPGWEKDVPDELLRADIAAAAAGDPEARLGDAALLAGRLRSLEARRVQLEADRAARTAGERAARMRAELRRLRAVAAVLLLLAGAAAAAGVVAFRARNEAQRAVETAQTVSRFLNQDLLARAGPGHGATRDLTVRKLLDLASATVDERFQDQPEAAAQVHATLGTAYLELDEVNLAHRHMERAVALHGDLYGPVALRTLDVRGQLSGALHAMGRRQESCDLAREVRAQRDRQLPADDGRRLLSRAALARCLTDFEDIERALPEITEVVTEFERRGMTDSDLYGSALTNLAIAYFDGMKFVEAEPLFRKRLDFSVGKLGPGHFDTTQYRALLANSLTLTGRLAEADAELSLAVLDQRAWLGTEPGVGLLTVVEAILRLEQGRFKDAERSALSCLHSPLGRQKGGGFRLAGLYVLAEAMLMQGRTDEAARLAEETLTLNREFGGRQFHEVPARAQWAEALGRQGKVDQGLAVLGGITAQDLAALPDRNVFYALFRRSQGLLLQKQGGTAHAREALQESRDIYQLQYGADHWRTKRAVSELSQLDRS